MRAWPVHAGWRRGPWPADRSRRLVQQATTAQIKNSAPPTGYCDFWWIGQGGSYQASGIFGQSISIIPDERLVIVLNSAWPTAVGRELFITTSALLNTVREAAKDF